MTNSLEEPFGAWELFDELWEKELATDEVMCHEKADELLSRCPYHDRLQLCRDAKNNARARELRARGNELFHPKVKRYIEAIKCYNESIAFSEPGSEERAIAYANRSMICFELQRYDECLLNIRLARESNYPERLADKLKKREEEATKKALLLAKAKKGGELTKGGRDELQLSYQAHETAPQVANCLELHASDQFGRYVVTNRALNAGDVVIIETPFCRLLRDVYRCVRCDYCHQERPFTLIPCESCTVAMYCTRDCVDKAYREYHRYECPILRDMWRIFTKLPVMSLRTVTTAIVAFDHNLVAMSEHLHQLDEPNVNAFSLDWTLATAKDVYDTVHVLETNSKMRDQKDRMVRVFYATIIHKLLLERTDLATMVAASSELSALLLDLLLRHLQTGPVNMHSQHYMEYQPDQQVYDLENHASACFPLLSMLNHSCAPNVTRITTRTGRCAILITRPIPKGGQLYDNYGMHHALLTRKERRTSLLKQYRFLCECEACVNDYPLFDALPSIDLVRHGAIDAQGIHAELVLHQASKAAELLPKLVRYLNSIGRDYPRYEICSCQELFLRSFQILHMPTSESAQYWKYCNPCRNDQKLVAHVLQYMTQALEAVDPLPVMDDLHISCKSNERALQLLADRFLLLSHGMASPDNMLHQLERLNVFLAHSEPGTAAALEALIERTSIAFHLQQDHYCVYNYSLLTASGSTGRVCSLLYNAARTRRFGSPMRSPFGGDTGRQRIYANVRCATSAPYGRLLLSTGALQQGTVVVRERPFARLLIADRHVRCDYCLAYAPFTLEPCQSCSLVMFCSQYCKNRAHSEYHTVECSLGTLLRTQHTNAEFLAARITIRLYNMFGDADLLAGFVRNIPKKTPNASYETPEGGRPGSSPEQSYARLYHLATNRTRRKRPELKQDGIVACRIARLLRDQLGLAEYTSLEILAEVTVRHIQVARTNALTLYRAANDPAAAVPAGLGGRTAPFALVLTSTGSQFNHACEPNVDYAIAEDGAIVFQTNRPVTPNEQMFITYW
uniref:MYND-type domain-containing protein n=1 Tax=Anopheles dirus TaxID=7168 RepID=A0A182N3X0_9DIPT